MSNTFTNVLIKQITVYINCKTVLFEKKRIIVNYNNTCYLNGQCRRVGYLLIKNNNNNIYYFIKYIMINHINI